MRARRYLFVTLLSPVATAATAHTPPPLGPPLKAIGESLARALGTAVVAPIVTLEPGY